MSGRLAQGPDELRWRGTPIPRGRPSAIRCTAEGGSSRTLDGFGFLVDASGRYSLLSAQHFRNRRPNKLFRNVAIWAYWTGALPLPNCPGAAST